jgi:P27 family predicted phage terminase small subunit
MAKRGRKPAPEPLKILSGTRADRRNPDAPAGPPGLPDPPEHLDPIALAEWARMAPLLAEMGVLSRVDGPALATYCQHYSRWVKAEAKLSAGELAVKGAKGNLVISPFIRIAAAAMAAMARMLVEFGCTPSSRSRVKSQSTAKADPMTTFLGKRKA